MDITTALVAGKLTQSSLNSLTASLDAVPEGAKRGAERIRGSITAYHDRVRAFEEDRRTTQADPMKSELAKKEAVQGLTATFKQDADSAIGTVRQRVDETLKGYRAKAPPPPLSPDAVLNEARLGNARTDAAMLLGSVPRESLARRMNELAENTEDSALKHLLLATDWPSSYLESRGIREAVPAWNGFRNRLLAEVLSDEGKAALEALQQLEAVTQIPRMLASSHSFYLRDRGL